MNRSILTLLISSFAAAASYGQGTIQFLNSTLSQVAYQATPGAAIVSAPTGCRIGVFWGTDAAGSRPIVGMGNGTLALPVAAIGATPGIWNGGAVYPILGTTEGQRVWLKIAGWQGGTDISLNGITHYGESIVVSVILGPTAGPGPVVWQPSTGTAPDRAKPFVIAPIPEPSVITLWAFSFGLGTLFLRGAMLNSKLAS